MARTPARSQNNTTSGATHLTRMDIAGMLDDAMRNVGHDDIPEGALSVLELAAKIGTSPDAARQRAQALVGIGKWKKGYRGRFVYYWKVDGRS